MLFLCVHAFAQQEYAATNTVLSAETSAYLSVETSAAETVDDSASVHLDDSAPVRDLGVSEVAAPMPSAVEKAPSYEEITAEAWEGKPYSAAELLGTLPGVQSYRQGGLGSFESVSIRGIAAREVVICIDGVPVNDGSGGATNLATIDLNQIEKVEVYRDRVPAKFGGAGIGGAVNFVTKSANRDMNSAGNLDKSSESNSGKNRGSNLGKNRATGKVLVSYGSHNFWEGAAQIGVSVTDSTQFSTAISARHSDNDYEFTNRNGTPYNEDDDFTDVRRNAEFTEYAGQFKYRTLHGNGAFSTIGANVTKSEGGNPGREDYQTKVAGYKGETAQLSYGFEAPGLLENSLWLGAGIAGRFQKDVSHSYYPLDHIGYESADYQEYGAAGYRLIPQATAAYVGDNLDANLRISGGLDRYEARGGFSDWRLSRYSGNAAGDFEYRVVKAVSVGGEGSVQAIKDDIHGGKFVMPTGTSAIENADDRDISYGGRGFVKFATSQTAASQTPSSQASSSQASRPSFGANASIGRFYRQPEIMELYGVSPGTVSNPDLKEESAIRFEAGLNAATPKNTSVLRATYFESHIENGIYWFSSANFLKAMNLDKTLVRGVELELQSHPAKFVNYTMRATFQHTEDCSGHDSYDGNMLPGEPARSYFNEIQLLLPLHLDASFSAEYRTKIYTDRANKIEQPATPRYRAALGFSPLERTRIIAAVDNISDETYRNIYSPFPTPGREFKITITQGF